MGVSKFSEHQETCVQMCEGSLAVFEENKNSQVQGFSNTKMARLSGLAFLPGSLFLLRKN
jgi:hypothetical protein